MNTRTQDPRGLTPHWHLRRVILSLHWLSTVLLSLRVQWTGEFPHAWLCNIISSPLVSFSEKKGTYSAANSPAQKNWWLPYTKKQLSINGQGSVRVGVRAAVTWHDVSVGELSGGEKLLTTLPQTSDPQLSSYESKIWSICFRKLLGNTDTASDSFTQSTRLLASTAHAWHLLSLHLETSLQHHHQGSLVFWKESGGLLLIHPSLYLYVVWGKPSWIQRKQTKCLQGPF